MHDVLDPDLDWVAENGIQQRVAAGGTLIRRGQPLEAVYVVLEGELVVESGAAEHTSHRRLRAGGIAGRLVGPCSAAAAATVRAEVDSVVLEIPRALLDARIARDPEFQARLPGLVASAGTGWVRAARARGTQRRPATRREPTPPAEKVENLRVYELIERMLRGDLPDR